MTTLRFSFLSHDRPEPRLRLAASRRPDPDRDRSSVLALALAAWRRRRSRNHLAAFDDHMLKDIGVTRAEAEREANKPFWHA